MIKTVAQLIDRLIAEEREELKKLRITHGPTIGHAYEDLTSDVLNKTIPEGLALDVASGFIRTGSGDLGPELDRMIVTGKGELSFGSIVKVSSTQVTVDRGLVGPDAMQVEIRGNRRAVFGTSSVSVTSFSLAHFFWGRSSSAYACDENAAGMASVAITESGDCLRDLGRLDEAASAYEDSVQRAEKRGDPRSAAVNKTQLGTVRRPQRRFDEALVAYAEARGIFEKLGEPTRLRYSPERSEPIPVHGQRPWVYEVLKDLAGEGRSHTVCPTVHQRPDRGAAVCRAARPVLEPVYGFL